MKTTPINPSPDAGETPESQRSSAPAGSARFVRMFKPQFAVMVESGLKCQTVRPTPKRRPAAGDIISLREWTGKPYRSKQRVIHEAEIVEVMDLEIYGDSMHVGNRRLSREQREAFAKADGFATYRWMTDWFEEQHGLPFYGIVIRWQNARGLATDSAEKKS